MSLLLASAAQGFGLGLSLIVAIGAQNAFVLRQGLRREQVGAVVAFCALADALLIAAGVLGAGWAQQRLPWLAPLLTGAGAFFLAVYGLRALLRASRPGASLAAAAHPAQGRLQALAQAAAFTLLNPHVYLDTVLLVGGIGAQQPLAARPAFIAGAAAASLIWFGALGFGAARLAPLLARPGAWRVLDGLMGMLMLALAATLIAAPVSASATRWAA